MKNKYMLANKGAVLKTLVFFSILLQWGCFGSSLESPGSRSIARESSHPTVVEAIIEYSGPAKLWSGPSTWVIHLVTERDRNKHPQVTFITEGQGGGEPGRESVFISVQEAKDALTQLRSAAGEEMIPFRGCLLPVRIQLIQANGTIFEKRACRGQPGWPQAADGWIRHWVALIEAS